MIIEQADETWLSEFKSKIKTDWDFTAIHVNKNNLEGVKRDIVGPCLSPPALISNKLQVHYSSYGKPIWVTEFACVNGTFDPSFNTPQILLIHPLRRKRVRTLHEPRRNK
jgi:hypothetical protein